MTSCNGWLLSLVAAVLLLAPTATAQTIDSPYRFVDESQSLGIFGGYIATSDGTLGLGPESAPLAGARYSLRVSGPFVVEGEASFIPTSRPVLDTARVDDAHEVLGEADLSLLVAQAALRFNLTGPRTFHGFQPYLLMGGGAAIELGRDDTFDEDLDVGIPFDFGTTFAAKIGAGIEWFATRRFTVRADVRDLFWQLETPPAFLEQDVAEEARVPESEWVQNFGFLLGFAYRF